MSTDTWSTKRNAHRAKRAAQVLLPLAIPGWGVAASLIMLALMADEIITGEEPQL